MSPPRSGFVFSQLADLYSRAQSGIGDPQTWDWENAFEDWTDIRDWMEVDWMNHVCIPPQFFNLSLTFQDLDGSPNFPAH